MQKTAVFIIIVTLFSLLLLGCRQEENVGTVTAVAVETIVVTRKVPITPSATYLPVVTSRLPESDTEIEKTDFPTIAPTSQTSLVTPTPEPTDNLGLVQVPIVSSQIYSLHIPSPNALATLFLEWFQFGNDYQNPNKSIYAFMGQDVLRYYPDGFPLALNLITDLRLNQWPNFGAWEVSSFHTRILHDGILQYLNQNQIDLKSEFEIETDTFRLTPYPINLDNDPEPEWFVVIESTLLWMQSHVLLDEESANHYVLLSDNFPQFTGRYYADGYTIIWTEYDVTGDGRNEILLYNNTYLGANDNDISLNVLSWDGSSIQQLGFINPYYHSIGEQEPQIEIADFNGDSVYDVQVSRRRSHNFDCDFQEVSVYTWVKNELSKEQNVQVNTPACYIYSNAPEENIIALSKALIDWEPTDAENASLIALAHIHLAMAQTATGQTTKAQATLDELYNLPADAQFVQLALQAYESAEKRPLQTCRNLLANADALLQTEIGQYLTWEKADPESVYFGGIDGTLPHLTTICNLQTTAEYLVKNTIWAATTSPLDLLTSQDIQYEFAVQINLDDDPELEWIGILEPKWPFLLVFDTVDGAWQPQIRWIYIDEVSEFVTASKDVTGDGKEDVIGLVNGNDFCFDLDKQTNEQSILMLYTEDHSVRFIGESFYCIQNQDEILTIDDITEAHFSSNPLPAALASNPLDDYPATNLPLHEYAQELQTAVLTQTDPDISTKITDLLNYLPSDDPEAQPYREHLTYLLGYHYELSGKEEEAVAIYLDLIQQHPSSPWSWLAWARLEPVENE